MIARVVIPIMATTALLVAACGPQQGTGTASPAMAVPTRDGTVVIPEQGHKGTRDALKDRHGTTMRTPAADPVNPPDLLVSMLPEHESSAVQPAGTEHALSGASAVPASAVHAAPSVAHSSAI